MKEQLIALEESRITWEQLLLYCSNKEIGIEGETNSTEKLLLLIVSSILIIVYDKCCEQCFILSLWLMFLYKSISSKNKLYKS